MIRHKLNFWPLLPVVALLIALVASRLIGGAATGNELDKSLLDEAACTCCLDTE